jgi:hypothetical protein
LLYTFAGSVHEGRYRRKALMRVWGLAVLFILGGAPAWGQQRLVTAEEGVELHRRTFFIASKAECGPKEAEEIVVCGGPRSPYRLPFSVDAPGQRVEGELPSAVEATKEVTCTNIGHTRGCPSIDILGLALTVGGIVARKVIEAVAEAK